MSALLELLDYRLPHVHTHIGGVMCFLIAAVCYLLIREFHKLTRCTCVETDNAFLSIRGYFALNASLFLFGFVMIIKGIERIWFSDFVTVLDLVRDTTVFFIWSAWIITIRRRRLGICKNKNCGYGEHKTLP